MHIFSGALRRLEICYELKGSFFNIHVPNVFSGGPADLRYILFSGALTVKKKK
jgi:hypothetical protein